MAAAGLFWEWDKDGNGELTADESPSPTFWDRIAAYDTNADGKLTQTEVQSVLEKSIEEDGEPVGSSAGFGFGHFFAGGEGVVRAERQQRTLPPSVLLRILDQVFERNDGDGNGAITQEEARPTAWKWLKDHDTNEDGKLELEEVRKNLEHLAL
jgi:hypothetical protein